MQRRRFLTSSLAASVMGIEPSRSDLQAGQQAAANNAREYYQLRRYHLQTGPQQKLTSSFVADALIPALNRLGMKPVGAFDLYIGPETPCLYLLIPSASLETLVNAEFHLARDEEYQRAGAFFLNAPAKEPAYLRVESSLMSAFEGWPKLKLPHASAQNGSRVFQLRTYESPTDQDHRRKVEMFNNGEFDVFQRAGFWQVFYGDTLIGSHLPNLTYMLSFPDLSELNAKWKAFGADPEWKKLRTSPRFSFEEIVSNITSLILNPTSYSQI
jgi:NIPSNAP